MGVTYSLNETMDRSTKWNCVSEHLWIPIRTKQLKNNYSTTLQGNLNSEYIRVLRNYFSKF